MNSKNFGFLSRTLRTTDSIFSTSRVVWKFAFYDDNIRIEYLLQMLCYDFTKGMFLPKDRVKIKQSDFVDES